VFSEFFDLFKFLQPIFVLKVSGSKNGFNITDNGILFFCYHILNACSRRAPRKQRIIFNMIESSCVQITLFALWTLWIFFQINLVYATVLEIIPSLNICVFVPDFVRNVSVCVNFSLCGLFFKFFHLITRS